MLVRMICFRLFVAAQVKSCPNMYSGFMIASLWLCSHSWPSSEIRGVTMGLIKGNY